MAIHKRPILIIGNTIVKLHPIIGMIGLKNIKARW